MMVPKSKTLKSGRVINSGFDIKKFDDLDIKSVVLDECQQIKNVDSARTQMVRRVVKGKKVIALSGTPWNNRGSELFPVLNMLDPMKFNSEEGFKTKWVSYFWQGAFRKEGGIKNIKLFREYTKDICIRRERAEVMPELPLINRTKLYVKMDPEKQESYDVAVDDFVKWFEEQSGNLGGMAIIAAMAKMRHLVALAKIDATQEYVNEFIEDTDRKIVVFAHHKDVQDMLFDYFKSVHGNNIPVLKFVSGMDSSQVHTTQTIFNESKQAILVASTIAAGEGLNLQTCCDCVLHERMWNPGREEQAESRFIRIGSVSTSVSAIYAHMEGLTAIDSTLDGIVERKRYQFHDGMNKGEMPQWNEDSLMKELAETIVNAHNAKKNKKILTTK
jgi:SNF2 family DNA or RNA helicase